MRDDLSIKGEFLHFDPDSEPYEFDPVSHTDLQTIRIGTGFYVGPMLAG